MKKILCYGDSNIYGFNPKDGSRYEKSKRIGSRLEQLAKGKYKVVENGCNGRGLRLSGKETKEKIAGVDFINFIGKESDFDLIIFALGLNDTQFQYNLEIEDIKCEMEKLIDFTKTNTKAKVLILSPHKIEKEILKSGFSFLFDESSIEKSKHFREIYYNLSKEKDCYFIDLNELEKPSDIDGLHYFANSHQKIADYLFSFIEKNIFA